LKQPLPRPNLLGVVAVLAAAFWSTAARRSESAGYASGYSRLADTSRSKAPEHTAGGSRLIRGVVIPGYLSSWGLPPVEGRFTVTDTGLVFSSSSQSAPTRLSTLSLAYVDKDNGQIHYLFRVDAGVFETDAPGALLDVAAHPVWLDSLRPAGAKMKRTLVDPGDPGAPARATRRLGASAYADTLYSLFGQPSAAIGLIGRRGRLAGRLGEYIAARDSLAFDPGRMTGEAQLRHALAHELGHRWQSRARTQLATLWAGVRSIRDPKRYGYGDRSEHQAEAIAFAINFLQATAACTSGARTSSLTLLDHYELLVPGTRTMVRYLALQPIYRHHPLRGPLTTGSVTYALKH
jgi:hypothetical protein